MMPERDFLYAGSIGLVLGALLGVAGTSLAMLGAFRRRRRPVR